MNGGNQKLGYSFRVYQQNGANETLFSSEWVPLCCPSFSAGRHTSWHWGLSSSCQQLCSPHRDLWPLLPPSVFYRIQTIFHLCSFLNSTFTINLDGKRLQELSLSILKYTMCIYYLCFLDSIWDWSLFFLSFICIKFFYKKSIQYKYHIGSQHGYYIRGQWEHNTGGHYEYNTCGGYKYNTSCKIWLKHKGSIWF